MSARDHAAAIPLGAPSRGTGTGNLPAPRPVGADEFRGSSRYELLVKIASGGSASVYVGRVTGSAGFSRLVAVKRAHPHLAHDPAVQKMMRTEARLASGLNHANVVAVQDVEQVGSELLLILDYVEGASLSELLSVGAHSGKTLPPRVALRIVLDACVGLAAVHEIEGKDGRPVGFLHRDVSPQNILVGVDGSARITDFGLAKHICSDASKASGTLQGKLAYLAPEIVDKVAFSVQSDLFAMAVVLWEAMARRRLFQGDTWADTVRKVGLVNPPPLSRLIPGLDPRVDRAVAQALDKDPIRRHPTVRAFIEELEAVGIERGLIATTSEVSSYVRLVVGDALRRRRALIRPFQPTDDDDLMTTQTFQQIPPIAAAAAMPAHRPAPPAAHSPGRTAPPPAPAPARHAAPRTAPPPPPVRVGPPAARTAPPPPPVPAYAPAHAAAPARASAPVPAAAPARVSAPVPAPAPARIPAPAGAPARTAAARTAPPPPPVRVGPPVTRTAAPPPAPAHASPSRTLESPMFLAQVAPAAQRGILPPALGLDDDEESTVNRSPAVVHAAQAERAQGAPRSDTLRTPMAIPVEPDKTLSAPYIAAPLPPDPPAMPRPLFAGAQPAPRPAAPAPQPPRARPQSSTPPAFVSSGALLRRPLQQAEPGPRALDEDVDDEDLKMTAVHRPGGAAAWSAPVKGAATVPVDPISPWVPPTMPPPMPSKPGRSAARTLVAGTVALAVGAGLAMVTLYGPLGTGGAGGAWASPAAAQPAAAPTLEVKPLVNQAAVTQAAAPKAAKALTPDALPDAERGASRTDGSKANARKARKPGEALTPDALPDAKPRR